MKNLLMNTSVADSYNSPAQRVRVITENWMSTNGYCPKCLSFLIQAKANSKVCDFICTPCQRSFELKSKKGSLGKKITDGAYSSMISRIKEDNSPDFFFLNYDNEFNIKNLIVVPSYFFQAHIIEKRHPLPETARRAGWIGCSILLAKIPNIGKINIVKNSSIILPSQVANLWRKTTFLAETSNLQNRGWVLDILKCIELLKLQSFSLNDLYKFEDYLASIHPNNNHIKAKIRQQLQLLRDTGYLDFRGSGKYEIILQ